MKIDVQYFAFLGVYLVTNLSIYKVSYLNSLVYILFLR